MRAMAVIAVWRRTCADTGVPCRPREHEPCFGEQAVVVTWGDAWPVGGEVARRRLGATGAWAARLGETGCSRRPPFSEPDGAAAIVEVDAADAEGAGSSGAGLEVESDQEKVKGGIGAGGSDGGDEFGLFDVVESTSAGSRPAGLGERGRRVRRVTSPTSRALRYSARSAATQVSREDWPVVPGRLRRARLACGFDDGVQVGDAEVAEPPVAGQIDGETPVRPIGRRGRRREGRLDLGDPVGERWHRSVEFGGGEQIGQVEPEGSSFGEHETRQHRGARSPNAAGENVAESVEDLDRGEEQRGAVVVEADEDVPAPLA